MGRFLAGVNLNQWILMMTPLFLMGFVALLFWVYRRSGKTHYEKISHLPFDGDHHGTK